MIERGVEGEKSQEIEGLKVKQQPGWKAAGSKAATVLPKSVCKIPCDE